jgi:hypothetical protein
MNYIYNEIIQHDTKFIKIPNNSKFESLKLYIFCTKLSNNESLFISVKLGDHLIKYKIVIDCSWLLYEIYEIIEEGNLGIKSICDIFYNFCNNYLSNSFMLTHTYDYINFAIRVAEFVPFMNGYEISYCTFDNYKKKINRIRI